MPIRFEFELDDADLAGPVAVAVAGQVDEGRLIAIGDPSIFINMMLRYPGNRSFAEGLVHYLVQGDRHGDGPGRLFVLANDFDERAGFGGVMPWRKTIDRRLAEIRCGPRGRRRWRADPFRPWSWNPRATGPAGDRARDRQRRGSNDGRVGAGRDGRQPDLCNRRP